ncbi:Streptogramin A acetyltransferase [Lacunisphaera limnophila]|uniref:Streptogramin A acetyltransferase n=1 Tax=Lacunisphaera limnophila TaxID=1838286 RepID=A0A1D8AVT1_9BACT|nr:acyltransferase [Lacunisphaera limnophila]AOS44992.1 Streptogramin A acetyltransferase [Lacunisphaera limnophila]
MKTLLIRLYTWFQLTFCHRFAAVGKQPRIGPRVYVAPDSVRLGDYCFVGHGGYLAGAIEIGHFVMLAGQVAIVGGDHRIDRPTVPMIFSGREAPRRTIIEDDVWIGHGATVMSGIRIGEGSVIAAGAVVTKDVAPYSIMAGVPARFIRARFDPAAQTQHADRLRQYRLDGLRPAAWQGAPTLKNLLKE